MCLVLLAHQVHPEYPLLLAANRDEFYDRPTAPAEIWQDAPDVLGGRDLKSGGTWLAVNRNGRWAAVTNFREAAAAEAAELSRGLLVNRFVTSDVEPEEYLRRLRAEEGRFGGYNLLVGDLDVVYWSSNRADLASPSRRLEPGIHGVSNHLLNTPWPKVVRGKAALAAIASGESVPAPDHLLEILLDETFAADHLLPATGVSRELERALSASFIRTPDYGTRSSTALLIGRDGTIFFAERRFDPQGKAPVEDRFEL